MKILVDASLPDLSQWFPKPFELTPFHQLDEVKAMLPGHQALVCRSTLRVDASLLADTQLQYVATASSGTDHIDHAYLAECNIRLFSAKGCNAPAVVDYVTSTVAWLAQHQYLRGSRVGIVGVGHVGTQVRDRLQSLDYEVMGFDPYQAQLNPQDYGTFEDLFDCDLLCIHANLHCDAFYPSKNLFNNDVLRCLKPGVAIINASRGGIVNETDLLAAMSSITYCTDVYLNEPRINPCIVDRATLCTPHIAGHTIEGKLNAVIQISAQLHQHCNLPSCHLKVVSPRIASLPKETWKTRALRAYDPYQETRLLKQSVDKTKAFLTLRHAHLRNDFTNDNT